MFKYGILLFCILYATLFQAQSSHENDLKTSNDSIKKNAFVKGLGNGYVSTKYFNFDLRYLIKYNQYEGIRTGIGGITNDAFSEKVRVNGYTVYGFRDHRFKYSVGSSFRLIEKSNTWMTLSYTDDLQETGSTKFLTDKRFFQFFEPRLLNIDLFHKHITKAVAFEHEISNNLNTETEFSTSNIAPTYSYGYVTDNGILNTFKLSMAKVALQWKPLKNSSASEIDSNENDYPLITLQYTKSFNDVFKSDLSFSKLDFRTIHQIGKKDGNLSEITLVGGIANGDIPLTHLYHAYPNNITKETIMQRFSVAGTNSFETMFFNEFFSDKFATFQLKHFLKPFNVSERYKPQMVLITRYAIGDTKHPEKHQNVTFGSLKKGYTESGFEINKLLFGFGLSFTYRYGAYHLPEIGDNVAFKFTFNLTL
ncbi:hypothetical protein EV196_101362 [Mariniflexile fucanivorans]|uniref:Surface antigen-like protein n=1 Tax=Mariniflexile fucanivorans TaxID=264023 RepID=A0A4R1RRH7_9FLAO|nr:hypothetical protein [Mariniflexile fucanivorans]TCL68936.1 hypothetical protein EV196_101362 [Mariniflexile fucanivorans]